MSEKQFDLESAAGRQTHLEYLVEQIQGRTASEIGMQTAVYSVQTSALRATDEWFISYGSKEGFTLDSFLEARPALIKKLLTTAAERFDSDMERAKLAVRIGKTVQGLEKGLSGE